MSGKHTIHAKKIETDEHGNVVITADLTGLDLEYEHGNADAHPIFLHPAAIGNRMVEYGLDTPEEAIDAILREHALRLSTLKPKSEKREHQLGGTDDRVKVEHSPAAQKHRKAALDQHADTIKQAVAYFTVPAPEG